ncbi:S-phase kinase-associated protein 2-like isoform X2 [Phyllopteryx taeniolatus]|uniref:S-phase kinase-associated protein 2-like isoform X2 n=1 Tax=Phyllopteryx taeniolatus TaxID=161469 RepID=UPI002AD54E29|nr:S-phase kinase-associated protein 2-like isoform X2 [Phyllopteryx taeniolatus]
MGKRGNNSKKRRRTSAEGGKGPKRKFPVDKAEDDNAKEDGGVPAWDHLQDELILRIFFLLPLRDLVRTSVACRRWHRLAFDESLWHSVDLQGVINTGLALEQVLKTGVRRLSFPGVHIDNRYLRNMCRLKITEMDLSMTEIKTTTLERIIGCCTRLECLSLSGMKLSCAILLIQHLNMSGCRFNRHIVKSIFNNVSSTVTALDLSGKYCYSSLDDLKAFVKRCPDVCMLHFNNWRITMGFLAVLSKLKDLVHLSLNGCLGLDLAAITDIKKTFPSLKYLRVIPAAHIREMSSLEEANPSVCVNLFPSFVIASPKQPRESVGDLRMWDRTIRLRFTSRPLARIWLG